MNTVALSALSFVSLAALVAACSSSPGGTSATDLDAGKTSSPLPADGGDTDLPEPQSDAGGVPPNPRDAAVRGGDPSDAITTPEELMAYAGAAPKKLDELKGIWLATGAGHWSVRMLIRDTSVMLAADCEGTVFGGSAVAQNTTVSGSQRRITWLAALEAQQEYCVLRRASGVSTLTVTAGSLRFDDLQLGVYQARNRIPLQYFTKIAD